MPTQSRSKKIARRARTGGQLVSSSSARAPLKVTLAISLAQGAALYLLTLAQINDAWPSGQPIWNLPLWTLAVAWPVLLHLSIDAGNTRRTIAGASLFASLLVAVAVYTGWQMSPWGAFPTESIVAVFLMTSAVACFKALMYLQPLAARRPVIYAELFANSWRNFLLAGLSAVMAGGIYLVLMLWASLLNVIGIGFFSELFQRMWFAFPTIAVCFGPGVFIFRGLARVIDGLTGLLEGLMRLLLPLVVVMLAVFLGALPFTGLEPLWAVGSGTALLMALNALALFFLNAVYQTGRGLPYPAIVHRLVYGGAVLLPIVSALALYGLSLRIAQYGWTVERCWALAVCVTLALFSSGYAGSILRLRDAWPRNLAFVNRSMGLAILALMLLTNSPLLDFRQISLESQQQRVESGEIELRDFDFFYARENLGRPAYLWTQELLEQFGNSDPELAELIRSPLPPWARPALVERSDIWERMVYRPAAFEVPEGVRREIDALSAPLPGFSSAPIEPAEPVLIEVDLNDDGVVEYVFVSQPFLARAFQRRGDEWQALALEFVQAPGSGRPAFVTGRTGIPTGAIGQPVVVPPPGAIGQPVIVPPPGAIGPDGVPLDGPVEAGGPEALQTALTEGTIETVDPEFKDLRIGDVVLRVVESP